MECYRLLDRGPSPQLTAESKKYTEFWGEKTEVRRFKDGSILESILWSPMHKQSIVSTILQYILPFKIIGIKADDVKSIADEFNLMLPRTKADSVKLIQENFDYLKNVLVNLSELDFDVDTFSMFSSSKIQ